MTRKIIPEMTYIVSGGTLNPTMLYCNTKIITVLHHLIIGNIMSVKVFKTVLIS